ncbi:MAG TPA: hypothetical protein VNR87_13995 [Flavisolibacter sp.]|nr:hypothetical protein [Flavisolibacter sp.]
MQIMELNEFERLSANVKIDLLHREGVYVGKCKNGSSVSVLYQFEGFYVEIFYRKYRSQIESIKCFTSALGIDAYLNGPD